jgi:hypothetical protein
MLKLMMKIKKKSQRLRTDNFHIFNFDIRFIYSNIILYNKSNNISQFILYCTILCIAFGKMSQNKTIKKNINCLVTSLTCIIGVYLLYTAITRSTQNLRAL